MTARGGLPRWRRLGPVLAGVGLAAILVATLTPSTNEVSGAFEWCFPCGEFGLSDAIANVLLFAPFGAGLAWSGVPGRRIVVYGFVFSLTIEIAQLWLLPGRDSTISDVVANTLGAALGVALARWLLVRRRSGPRTLGAVAILLSFIVLVGAILRPSFPDAIYYGQWTDSKGVFEQYRGRVLSADIGGMPLPSDRLANSRTVRAGLERGELIRIRAIAGPRTSRFAPLFSISPSLLDVGPDGDDLVLKVRRRAANWWLRQPDLSWRGAMAGVATGAILLVEVSHSESGYCLRVDDRQRCGVAYTLGQLWGLVDYFPEWQGGAKSIMNYLALALMGLPIGLLFRRGRSGYAAVVIAFAGVLALPGMIGFAPTPPLELAAFLLGGAAGVLPP